MFLDVIHLALFRLMTSHHVICHVTAVTCLFIIQKKNSKRKSKEKKYKIQEKWIKEKKNVNVQMLYKIKDLVFKERPARKLVDQYIGPYIIDKIVSTNTIKLQL